MTISELYKQEVERFNKEFDDYAIVKEQKKSLRQTYLNICDLQIEKAEGEKREEFDGYLMTDAIETIYFKGTSDGFNLAKQQDIEYWKEQKEIISNYNLTPHPTCLSGNKITH